MNSDCKTFLDGQGSARRNGDDIASWAHAELRASRRRHETFKAQGEPVSIGEVLGAIWQMYGAAMQPLQSFEHRAIVLREQALGYMKSVVGNDADQMSVKGGVMNFGQRNAVRHHWLPKLLVLVGDDMCGVKE